MLKMLPEWLWPRLQPLSIAMQIDQAERIKTRRDKITTEQWVKSADVALEEARRLFDAEQDRRRGADSKAAVYLAVITALIPVLAAVLPSLWKEGDNFYSGVLLFFFTAALIYLLRAGLWAFETIRVSGFSQVDPIDLLESKCQEDLRHGLIKKLLLCLNANMDGTNKKVSCIKMTHEFLWRTFISFGILLLFNALWPGTVWLLEGLHAKVALLRICPL